jgi:hypothetical protein
MYNLTSGSGSVSHFACGSVRFVEYINLKSKVFLKSLHFTIAVVRWKKFQVRNDWRLLFSFFVEGFAMKFDKVALPILVTAVFNYEWCIKCGIQCIDIEVSDPGILLHVYDRFMWLPSALRS